jgi:hypothetical protein
MTIPVLGSSGPGAQIPIAVIDPSISVCESAVARTASIAEITAVKPAAALLAAMGVRIWKLISPSAFTRPAATFVPPTSTPMRYPLPETCVIGSRQNSYRKSLTQGNGNPFGTGWARTLVV